MLPESGTALVLDLDGTLFKPGQERRAKLAYFVLWGALRDNHSLIRKVGVKETFKRVLLYAPALAASYFVEKIFRNRYYNQVEIFNKMTDGFNSELGEFLEKGEADLEKNVPKKFLVKLLKNNQVDVYFNSAEPLNIQKYVAQYLGVEPKKYYQAMSMHEKIGNVLGVSKNYSQTIWVDDHAPLQLERVICVKSIYELPKYI